MASKTVAVSELMKSVEQKLKAGLPNRFFKVSMQQLAIKTSQTEPHCGRFW